MQFGSDYEMPKMMQDAVDTALQKRGKVNVLVAGKTGVGKSTLINAVFQGNLATTGQGRPVTTEIREVTKSDVPVAIFDTVGLEIIRSTETMADIHQFVAERSRRPDPQEHIHVGWVCIAEDSRRIEDAEIDLTNMLAQYMPVVAIVTKARSDGGFAAEVQRLLPNAVNVVRVRALRETFDDGYVIPPMGLDTLVDLTMEVVPEGQKNALAAAQKIDLKHKVNRSHAIVASAAATAGTAGAVPIPFADAALIVPTQIGMLAGISATFGIPVSSAFLGTLVSGALTGTGGTLGGRMIAAELLKLIPGAGSFVGGVINASTAMMLTTACGHAYISVLQHLMSNDPDATPTADQIAKAFKQKMSSE